MLTQTFRCETSTLDIDRADRCGLFLSSLCALHCLVLPTVISSIPAFLITESSTTPMLQIVASSLSSLLAMSAVGAGYRVHRSRGIVTLAIAGVALQLGSTWLQSCQCGSTPMTVHAADCPCRESCGWMVSECKYVATSTPVVSSAILSTSWTSPIGAILLVIAHLRNWQVRKCHEKDFPRLATGTINLCCSAANHNSPLAPPTVRFPLLAFAETLHQDLYKSD